MRAIVICDEVFAPANSGGRRAVSDDIRLLKEQGVDVAALVFHRDPVDEASRQAMEECVSDIRFVQRHPLVRTTLKHPATSYQVASRCLGGGQLAELLPADLIIAQHEWCLPVAVECEEAIDTPLVLRSHNDEVEYLRHFAACATGLRRIYNSLEALRFRPRHRSRLVSHAAAVWTITEEDSPCYPGMPIANLGPRIPTPQEISTAEFRQPARYGFIGALDVPHARAGLDWFLSEVWPSLLQRGGHKPRLLIAGRRIPAPYENLLRRQPNVEVLGEVPEPMDLLDRVSVFINPVHRGAGINYKMVDAIAMGMPIVTTVTGARGWEQYLPAEARARSSIEFVDTMLELQTEASWRRHSAYISTAVKSSLEDSRQQILRCLSIV